MLKIIDKKRKKKTIIQNYSNDAMSHKGKKKIKVGEKINAEK